MPSRRLLIISAIFVVGVVALALGAVYWTTGAHDLPTFFPGYAKDLHHNAVHKKRALVGLLAGLLLIGTAVALYVQRRRRKRY